MPEHWEVRIHRKVNDVVYALPLEVASFIRQVISGLRQNPYPPERRLVGSLNDVYELFRGNYRIVYQIQEAQKTLKVVLVHLASEIE